MMRQMVTHKNLVKGHGYKKVRGQNDVRDQFLNF